MSLRPFEVVQNLLAGRSLKPTCDVAEAFAPMNVALIKYWGKREAALNLPLTDSLSLTFPEWGTRTCLSPASVFSVRLNGVAFSETTSFGRRIATFLDLFHLPFPLSIDTFNTIPTAAGVASSSSGFAALVLALDQLLGWGLGPTELSLLARLGSGSACRSFWPGFVVWQRGKRADGLDSHGVPMEETLPDLRAGILVLTATGKSLGSRDAMALTRDTSRYMDLWSEMVARDMRDLRSALSRGSFEDVGHIAETQALSLHWLMGTASPPVCYTLPETLEAIRRIHDLRASGQAVYWTQDAGPNLKLLFRAQDAAVVQATFPQLLLSQPFSKGVF